MRSAPALKGTCRTAIDARIAPATQKRQKDKAVAFDTFEP
jgi:hypothetical protein